MSSVVRCYIFICFNVGFISLETTLTTGLFRTVLFNFQSLGGFSTFNLMLVSVLILLWSKNTLHVISVSTLSGVGFMAHDVVYCTTDKKNKCVCSVTDG